METDSGAEARRVRGVAEVVSVYLLGMTTNVWPAFPAGASEGRAVLQFRSWGNRRVADTAIVPIRPEVGYTCAVSLKAEVTGHTGHQPMHNPNLVVTNPKTTPRNGYETV